MAKSQLKEVFNRVLNWPPEDQEKVARVVLEMEELRGDDISDEEWSIIAGRASRRHLESDEAVKQVFDRYR